MRFTASRGHISHFPSRIHCIIKRKLSYLTATTTTATNATTATTTTETVHHHRLQQNQPQSYHHKINWKQGRKHYKQQQRSSLPISEYRQRYYISFCCSSYHSSSLLRIDDTETNTNSSIAKQIKQRDKTNLLSTTEDKETEITRSAKNGDDENKIEDLDDEDDDPNIIINTSGIRRLGQSKTLSNEIEKRMKEKAHIYQLMGNSLLAAAGRKWKNYNHHEYNNYEQRHHDDSDPLSSLSSSHSMNDLRHKDEHNNNDNDDVNDASTWNCDPEFIPQISITGLLDGRERKRVLVLCTGGTLCMAPDPNQGYALAPVQGALSKYMKDMNELNSDEMPDVVLHEYNPFYDSSDLGPADWIRVANDIRMNYYDFDGFVVLSGTDTMAYFATALSFLFENLNKPIVFTGSQIPLCQPYNDGRRNLIMALIFASSNEPINEVTIFFHDRLLRANRTTKVNTQSLLAFDSPNQMPLADIGIRININEHLLLPQAKGQLRVHNHIDTRILTLRLVPGFDDSMISEMIHHNVSNQLLSAMIIQFYGTGNLPSVKSNLIQLLADATSRNILVVASTQCHVGSVVMGQYAVGKALESAGVIGSNDMTIEAIACKIGYLLGRCDLSHQQISKLMGISLRGEITPYHQMLKSELNPPTTPYHRRF